MAKGDKYSDEHAPGPGEHSRETAEQAAYEDERLVDVHVQVNREKEEPTEGFSPIPLFILFLTCPLIFWAGMYFVKYSGNYQYDVFDPNKVPSADVGPPPVIPWEEKVAKKGARIYNQCAACHQANGMGVAGLFPPLGGSKWVNGDERRIVNILLWGLNGPIEVVGNEYNGNMPAYTSLKDEDIRIIASYVRTQFGNDSGYISEGVVEAMRAEHSGRGPWTGDELLALYPLE